MTAAHTRSPKWIKRALIGTAAALVAAGGITVAANAAPGDVHRLQGVGLDEAGAERNGMSLCESGNMDYKGRGPAEVRRAADSSFAPTVYVVPVECSERG